jgi:hypothetical protein
VLERGEVFLERTASLDERIGSELDAGEAGLVDRPEDDVND